MGPRRGGNAGRRRAACTRRHPGARGRVDHVRALGRATGPGELGRSVVVGRAGSTRDTEGTERTERSECSDPHVAPRDLGTGTTAHVTPGHLAAGHEPAAPTRNRAELIMTLDSKTWWYVTRASGYVSWSLLAIAVLWGLFLTNKTLTKTAAPAWVLDLHRHLGGLAVVFVAIHVGALPLDSFTHWGWRDLAIPMASKWHPGAIAWGIVAAYLLLAIEVTSLLGRRFPKKWWRRVHILSFPLYVIASIHLFAAGTDSGNVAAQWLVVTVSTLIVFLAGIRGLAAAKPRETANPRVAAAKRAAAAAATTTTATTTATAKPSPARNVPDDLLPAAAPVTPATEPRPAPAVASAAPVEAKPALTALTVEERVGRIRAATDAAAQRVKTPGRQPVPVGAPSEPSDPG